MGLLTIGAFARATGLTPKALRLYADLGLLTPAAVDPENGYRRYHPAQVGRGRLIAELRAVGMPLAEIGAVSRLPPAAAAGAVRDWWAGVAADTSARGARAAGLAGRLSGGTGTMTRFRYAARCETGAVRDSNEDTAYAGEHVLAVADGMRGPGGAEAARTAVDAVRALDGVPAGDALARIGRAVDAADRSVREWNGGEPDRGVREGATGGRGAAGPGGSGPGAPEHRPVTTLTAVVLAGDRLVLAHVGDTRAYLLRDGDLIGLTRDHTWVRQERDQGRLTAGEAAAHPDRTLLVRAVGAGPRAVDADFAVRTVRPGDRLLLCSDGLAPVDRGAVRAALGEPEAGAAVDRLVELACAAGAPDNIACVVADVVP